MGNVNVFAPDDECKSCKGRCCREMGCALCPDDLKRFLGCDITEDAVIKLLTAPGNMLAIDSFVYHGQLYYVRMRHKCYTFIGVDAIGECAALTESGCIYSDSDRPLGGRALKPGPDSHCAQEYTDECMAADWKPFQKILRSIYTEYERKFTEDGTFDRCDEEYYRWLRERRENELSYKGHN